MENVFFVSDDEWPTIRDYAPFDFVVIGSGFCAYAFIKQVLENSNGTARILVLERGPFFLPEHFQNLPIAYQGTLGGFSETFPWTLSVKTHKAEYIQFQHGMIPFFGGRSTLWSGWCPTPSFDESHHELDGWPKAAVNYFHKQGFFQRAKRLLNVTDADKIGPQALHGIPCIGNSQPSSLYATLQQEAQKSLAALVESKTVEGLTRVIPAPLAVTDPEDFRSDYTKYSVVGPFLKLIQTQRKLNQKNPDKAPIRVATDCTVNRILHHEGTATALDTTRGLVPLKDAKLVLAMGTMPPATLLLNSFSEEFFKDKFVPGETYGAHFISSIVARYRRSDFPFGDKLGDLELGAIYLAGADPMPTLDSKGKPVLGPNSEELHQSWHAQITLIFDHDPEMYTATAAHYMPDVVATASEDQMQGSKDYVLLVCACLGETNLYNKNNKFFLPAKDNTAYNIAANDPAANCVLQLLADDNDNRLWDHMEEAVFQALEKGLGTIDGAKIEYWGRPGNSQQAKPTWIKRRPTKDVIRVPGLVHESSTLQMGTRSETSAVDCTTFRPWDTEGIYVTGGGLWPSAASWNPTMAMVGLAQSLADQLCPPPAQPPAAPSNATVRLAKSLLADGLKLEREYGTEEAEEAIDRAQVTNEEDVNSLLEAVASRAREEAVSMHALAETVDEIESPSTFVRLSALQRGSASAAASRTAQGRPAIGVHHPQKASKSLFESFYN